MDAERGVWVCPQGKELSVQVRNQRNRYRLYDIYHAWAEDCAACPVRGRCLIQPKASRRYLSVPVKGAQPNVLDEMKARIDSPAGKKTYARRLAIVEPVFANVCVQKRMNRFTLRFKSESGCTMDVVCIWYTTLEKSAYLGRDSSLKADEMSI